MAVNFFFFFQLQNCMKRWDWNWFHSSPDCRFIQWKVNCTPDFISIWAENFQLALLTHAACEIQWNWIAFLFSSTCAVLVRINVKTKQQFREDILTCLGYCCLQCCYYHEPQHSQTHRHLESPGWSCGNSAGYLGLSLRIYATYTAEKVQQRYMDKTKTPFRPGHFMWLVFGWFSDKILTTCLYSWSQMHFQSLVH